MRKYLTPASSVILPALLLALVFFHVTALAMPVINTGKPAADYLPPDTRYNPDITSPEDYLGANVGQWHVRHDQLVGYLRLLAAQSDRVTLEQTGTSHENRPLLLLTITAAANQPELASLREQHLARLSAGKADTTGAPLVLYMGYSIHGNEPSGANAALLIAYYLSAGQSKAIDTLLQDNIVLLDPAFNPDGLSRFAQWANMHKGYHTVSDPRHREHAEGWPSGRTNHYWFDLNRDWLLLTHPESRARIAQFHKWRPHILTDFHEMGPNSTYFFQPGVPDRKNPNTPDGNVTLTEALASFHIDALDKAGQLYFSQESFDDFYYGKGSSYPDALGSIGILFEQASSRGHVQETINGPLTFTQTIANQVTTSLSTFAGALANKPAILSYQRDFARHTDALINDDDAYGFVIRRGADHARFAAMTELLQQHQIQYAWTSADITVNRQRYPAHNSIFVPLDQPGYRLIKSLFSTRQSFPNNTFYDVSNWNLPLAFNLTYDTVDRDLRRKLKTGNSPAAPVEATPIASDAYAWVLDWHSYEAPAALQYLLSHNVQARSAQTGFTSAVGNKKNQSFAAGSVVIPAALEQPDNLPALLDEAARRYAVSITSLASGHTLKGIDIGSRDMRPVTLPEVLIVGGKGTREYEVGEVWHYLDTRVGLAPTIIEQQNLGAADLSRYTHIIFTSGQYRPGDTAEQKLLRWVKQGGVLIGQRNALKYFDKNRWLNLDIVSRQTIDDAFDTTGLTFADQRALYAKKLIAGAVYQTRIDTTHPLFFGYEESLLPVFKTSNMIVRSNTSAFSTPSRYTASPLMAGYSAPQLATMVAGSAATVVQPAGRGVVIGFVDDIHFRGYWYGTSKLLSNALYQTGHLL
ncbi:M14 family zinc carboxypeptidase [Salinimonas lutimaris]|uniref:M14 family zinc carboxypeptidase n=1 Tax=Salinimonas lutimaris TaxID=914153 RepID=UPI0010BFE7AB|nr:M14 family zinc carboxypeptidase [Salinimonas lutimaris]